MNLTLQQKISNNPTKTFLRFHSEATAKQFEQMPKAVRGRDILLPNNFDGRKVWKGLLTPVRNQGKCGSCWAFATTGVLADKFAIQSSGRLKVILSPTKLVLCDFMGQEFNVTHPEEDVAGLNRINIDSLNKGACRGNTLFDAWRYLYLIGTCTESCLPYDKTIGNEFDYNSLSDFQDITKLPLCMTTSGPIGDMCLDVHYDKYSGEEFGTPARFYRCLHFYSVPGTAKDNATEENIRHNIYCWGPVSTGITIYNDFYEFDSKNTVYSWNGKGDPVGGHAVEIVGWGEENGKKYWIIKNTWGVNWGREGYFYMERGVNMCGIEDNVITGVPDFFYPEDYLLKNPDNFIQAETPSLIAQRRDIDTSNTITGGGIDPTTGYTRRILKDKPWINSNPPINYRVLPDWNTFIAADVKVESKKNFRILVIILIFLVLIIYFIYKIIKR